MKTQRYDLVTNYMSRPKGFDMSFGGASLLAEALEFEIYGPGTGRYRNAAIELYAIDNNNTPTLDELMPEEPEEVEYV